MKKSDLKKIIKECVKELNEEFVGEPTQSFIKELSDMLKKLVPYADVSLSAIGNESISIRMSLDKESSWGHGIYQNSRYAIFYVTDGVIELNNKHRNLPKFRKSKYKSAKDLVEKIKKWIKTVGA